MARLLGFFTVFQAGIITFIQSLLFSSIMNPAHHTKGNVFLIFLMLINQLSRGGLKIFKVLALVPLKSGLLIRFLCVLMNFPLGVG